ncbi:hypothetical protein [Streptomyces sp. NBC_01565]|uniref:hypothetical protein n=1 Tax=Streptomyces sp. NBC_01565 TaxID=2975881 RepID=UPI00224CFA63|nr:hypothetical protein [Streptomyces sp. NBC_01565]MCX4539247.1 hypothetical protein [Streptomyces sp. NBC_01565]
MRVGVGAGAGQGGAELQGPLDGVLGGLVADDHHGPLNVAGRSAGGDDIEAPAYMSSMRMLSMTGSAAASWAGGDLKRRGRVKHRGHLVLPADGEPAQHTQHGPQGLPLTAGHYGRGRIGVLTHPNPRKMITP